MEKEFIKNLDKVINEYPFPKIHKIIICLILAMIRIRHSPYYVSEIDSAVHLTRIQIFSMIYENDEVNYDKLKNDIDKIFGIIIILPDLKKEIKVINKYCMEKMPAGNIDTFEKFLNKRFN